MLKKVLSFIENNMSRHVYFASTTETLIPFMWVTIAKEDTCGGMELELVILIGSKAGKTSTTKTFYRVRIWDFGKKVSG